MGDPHRPTASLARCVGEVDEFEAEYWGLRPLLRRGRAGGDFSDIFTIASLDDFLASGVRRPLVRLVRNGQPVAESRYTSRVRLGGSDFHDVIDPAKVAELFAAGTTVVAQSLHRTHPDVRDFVQRLGDEISHPVQANAYLTPAGAVGLAPHADRHDVIVLQLEGSKHWSVDGIGDVELRAGDTMYVPAGRDHGASSTDHTSLHLTIGILRVTYRAVIDRVLDAGPAVLDEALPLRYRTSPGSIEGELRNMTTQVERQLRSLDVGAIERAERHRRSNRTPRPGALLAAVGVADLDPTARLVRCGAPWSFDESEPTRIRIIAGGHHLSAPASCARAIRQLNEGFTAIDDLVGLDRPSRLILARRMVASGFCRIVDVSSAALQDR